jgi:hypothetical protein
MSKEPRRTRLLLVPVIALLIIPFGTAYRAAYYRTTTLTVGTHQLDWYAHRKFSSRAHYIVFCLCFIGRVDTIGQILVTCYNRTTEAEGSFQFQNVCSSFAYF